MAEQNFQPALRKVLTHEGGYSNDREDPGGATMWGITHIDYDAYRKRKGRAPQDVRQMSPDERDEIYRSKYWNGSRCDEMPSGVDYVLFDGAVNSGVAQSAKWLQRALDVVADGSVGDVTISHANEASPESLIHSMCDQRRKFLRSLRTFSRFGKGWIRRVDEVERAAIAMIAPHGDGEGATETGAKARPSDVAQPLVSTGTATATTVTSGGIGSALQQFHDQIAPLSDAINYVKYALLAIAVIGAGITLYSFIQSQKLKEV